MKKESWLAGEVVEYVGFYGSEVDDGFSAFNAGLVYYVLQRSVCTKAHIYVKSMEVVLR